MPVNMANIDGKALLKQLSLTEENKKFIEQDSVVVKVNSTSIDIQDALALKSVLVPIKLAHCTLLKNGDMTHMLKSSLSTQFNLQIKSLISGVQATAKSPLADAKIETTHSKPKPFPAKKDDSPTKQQITVLSTEFWPTYPLDKLTDNPVKLRDATYLYQPVKGSSPASVYFLIAGSPGFNLAARILDESISIRGEGDLLSQFQTVLLAQKMMVKAGYCSLHLTVGDALLQRKVIGSMLMGLNIAFRTPLPNIDIIRNKGV